MINLQFLNLEIEGFQSIGQASLDFNNLGTCYIKGVNRYDSKTKSNGSGKSSLLMSIYWTLFGKTPAGIGNDVVNKFAKIGCSVKLVFKIDGVLYEIRRSQNHKTYKTNLTILKDSEDISGRNKSDSEKVIKDILKIDEDVFSQMIFLSQGFANRFAIYSPKARKELLESLYNIDERLEVFVNELKNKESIKKTELYENEKSVLELTSEIRVFEDIIDSNSNNITNVQSHIDNLINTKFNISKKDIDELSTLHDEVQLQIDKLTEKSNTHHNELRDISLSINSCNQHKQSYINEINGFANNKVCPTCGTLLEDYEHNEHIQMHIKELNDKISQIDSELMNLNEKYSSVNEICTKIDTKLNNIKRKYNEICNELTTKRHQYELELQKDTQIKAYKDQIVEYTNNITEAQTKINENNTKITDINEVTTIKEKELEIIQHSIRLANNQFKSYLLENIITLLNSKLEELSVSLYENEIIKINGDNKLDILIGDKTYEQCSGGEQRKCDIALIIAQRFLAQQMNSISSNILICDEIFDGLDEVSFGIILDLLSDEIQDVESTFIISHRDIKEIPFDKIITVTKNTDQISTIEIS